MPQPPKTDLQIFFEDAGFVSDDYPQPPGPTPQSRQLNSFFEQARRGAASQTKTKLSDAEGFDPESYANSVRISEDTGIPADVVDRNPDMAKRQRQTPENVASDLQEKSPTTYNWLGSGDNARVARDDVENLGLVEQIVQEGAEALVSLNTSVRELGVVASDVGEAALSGVETVADIAADFTEQFEIGIDQRRMLELGYEGFRRGLTEEEEAELQRLEESVQRPTGEYWTGSAGRMLPSMLNTMLEAGQGAVGGAAIGAAAGAAGGPLAPVTSPAGALAGAGAGATAAAAYDMFQMGLGEAFLELRAFRDENGQPLEPEVLTAATILIGSGVGLLDTAVLPLAVRNIPGVEQVRRMMTREGIQAALRTPSVRAALKRGAFAYAGNVAVETLTEAAQEILLVVGGELAKAASEGEFEGVDLDEGVARAVEAGTEAFRASAVLAGAGAGTNVAMDVRRAQKAQQNQRVIEALGEAAGQSKLKGRLPQRFRDFVEQARNNGAIEEIGISSREFTEYFQEKNVDPNVVAEQLGVSSEEYSTALSTGSDIVVKVENLATELAGTEHYAPLTKHMRLQPEDMTLNEAELFEANGLAEDIERAAARLDTLAEDPVTRVEDLEVIRQEVTSQLAEAGIEPRNARYYADLTTARYAARAERTGRTPLQLWRQDNLQVEGEQPTLQAKELDQLDVLIEQARTGEVPSPEEITGPSLGQFLAEQTVETPAELAELAVQEGYLSEGAQAEDLQAALADEEAGRPVTSPARANPQAAAQAQAIQDLTEFLDREGVDLAEASNEEVRELVERRMLSADDEVARETYFQAVGLREGRETLEEFGLDPNAVHQTRTIARALEARQAKKFGTTDRADRSEEAEKKIARWMGDEVKFEMRPGNEDRSGVGWYSFKFQNALDTFGELYPELVDPEAFGDDAPPGVQILGDQENARDFLTALIAVTSDGLKVYNNFSIAADVYRQFRETGVVPDITSGGRSNANININLRNIAWLLDKYGPSEMHSWLLHEDTVSNLKKAAKAKGEDFNAPYPAQETLPFATLVFGPKLGAFYANLMGAEGYLTMDRWWSRTYNRYRGTLLTSPTKQGMQRVKELMIEDRNLDITPEQLTDEMALQMASDYVASYRAKNYKNGTTVERAANTVYKAATEGLEDMPFNTSDRGFMIRTVKRAKRNLKRAGFDLTIADIQAILWYYEKRLYSELGARATADVSYEETAQRVVEEAGDRGSAGPVLEASESDPVDTPDGNFVDAVSTPAEALEQRTGPGGGTVAGSFTPQSAPGRPSIMRITTAADLSTFLHESGHMFLEQMAQDAAELQNNEQIQRDAASIARWLGTDDLSNLTRDQHEQWARGFEAYLREGSAPSVGLQSAFDRFAAWLQRIYRSLRQLDVELNDNIRRVMDRMVATDREIEAVESLYEMEAFFGSAREAGMTKRDYESYLRSVNRAKDESRRNLMTRHMRALEREQAKWWNEEEDELRAQVRQELNRDRAYQALFLFGAGTRPDGTPIEGEMVDIRLNRAATAEVLGSEAALRQLPKRRRNVYAQKGFRGVTVTPDEVAPFFGYSSGSEMLQDMISRPDFEGYVAAEAAKRMRERHGDPLTRPTEAAIQATHNDKRGEVLARELRALSEGQQTLRPAFVREWARRRSLQMTLEELRPQKFLSAERRAAVKAGRALAKGDRVEAMQAKSDQLLNHYLAQESYKVRDEIEKGNRYMAKFQSKRKTFPGIDPAYLQRIQTVVNAYQIGPRLSERKRMLLEMETFAAWVGAIEGDAQARDRYIEIVREANVVRRQLGQDVIDPEAQLSDDNGAQLVIPRQILIADERTHYRDLKLVDYRGLVDTVRNLEHLGRSKKKWQLAQEKRSFDEQAALVVDRITEVTENPRVEPPEAGAWDFIGNGARSFWALLRKTEALTYQLDGYEAQGPVWSTIYEPLNAASDREGAMMNEAVQQLAEIFGAYSRKEQMQLVRNGVHYPEIGETLTKAAVLSMALNWGNLGNREALKDGYKWTDEAILSVFEKILDKRDWDFVQSVWDYIDTYWDQIAELERRTTGVAPEKVERARVVTPYGTYEGGYYPLQYDLRQDERARRDDEADRAKQLFGGAYARAGTRHGHTISRVGSGGRPVTLSLDVIPRHLNSVIHDLTHREAVVGVDRMLRRSDVTRAIKEATDTETYRAMESWIKFIAAGDQTPQLWIDKMLRYIRGGVSIASMGIKLTTALVQFTGYTQTIVRLSRNGQVGEYWAVRGLIDYMRNPIQHFNRNSWVFEKSPYMPLRAAAMDRDVRDFSSKTLAGDTPLFTVLNSAINQADRATGGNLPHWMALPKMTGAWFYFIQVLDNIVATASWIAGYEQGLNMFDGDDAKAVAHADSIVRESQSSGLPKDLSQIQRGSETAKLFTAFYSYFNATYNLMVDEFKRQGRPWKNPRNLPRFAMNVAWLTFIPAVLSELILARGPEDDEEWGEWFVDVTGSFSLAMFPFIREIGAGIFSDYPPSGPPVIAALLSGAKAIDKGVEGDLDSRAFQRNALRFFGVVTHTPTAQIWNVLDGMQRAADGEDLTPFEILVSAPPKD